MVKDKRVCYFPNGGEARNNVPCTSDTNTWCCGDTDLCLDNGLCLNAGHQPYILSRGSCTSQGWVGCTPHCTKSTPDGGASITNTFFNGSKALYCCGTPVALGSSLRCPAHSDNGGEPFEVANGKVITGRGLLENFTPLTNTSSSIGNSTSNGTVTEKPKCNSCHETAIGAGVGVPLGCLALLFLVWALLERRRTARLRRALSTPTVTTALASRQAGPSELSDPSSKGQPVVELEGARPELDGGGPIRV